MKKQSNAYRVYQESHKFGYCKGGWKVIKSIDESGEDFGESGDLIAYIPESRDLARFVATYLNGRKKGVRYGR